MTEKNDNGRKPKSPIYYVEESKPSKPTPAGTPKRIIEYYDEEGKIIKDPSERVYLLLYKGVDENGDELNFWEVITGQAEVRKFIINMIDYINVDESKILVDNIQIGDIDKIMSVYVFLKHMEPLYDDGFDVEPYSNYVRTGGHPVE